MNTERIIFVAAVIGSLVLVNLVGLRVFGRLDVTHDRAFTLSQATKDTMAQLEEPLTITAYFTNNLPAPYSSNARYVRDLLEEYRAASKGKVAFEFIDPAEQESDTEKASKREVKQDIFGRRFREPTAIEKELTEQGIQPVEIRVIQDDQQQTKRAWMGLVLKYNERKEVIPVVKGIDELEYDLTSLIRKMTRVKQPVIGVLQGHGEPELGEKLRFLQTALAQTYEVRPVELKGAERFDAALDAILVIGPKTALPAAEVKALDQFLMQGKAVALFLDRAQVDLQKFAGATQVNHGLDDWLKVNGVTLGPSLIADVSSASINISEQRGYMVVQMPVPYPFLAVVKQLEGGSAITKGLSEVLFAFTTEVSVAAVPGVTSTVLARSSNKSWVEKAQPPNVDPRRDWRGESPTFDGPHPLLVQLSGTLKSQFAAEATQSAAPGAAPVLAESKSEARLVVAGTSGLVNDEYLNQSRTNQALVLNIADWLVLDPAMLAMRSRGMQLATLKPDVSDGTRNLVKFGNALGLPLLLAVFGLVRWRLREARRSAVQL